MYIAVRLMISYSHLCISAISEEPYLVPSAKNFAQSFSNYKHFFVSITQQLSGLHHCGYILYNWPLRMQTSTAARMIRHTMTAPPRQHTITISSTGIGGAAGQNVYRQWRTTQSLWIVWRNVHWVGSTHTLTYRRHKQMIIQYFGPRNSPQVDHLLDAWEGGSVCVDWLLLVHIYIIYTMVIAQP